MNNLLAGSTAGLLATAPMTAAMELMYRSLPSEEQYPLPPREITDEVEQRTGVGDRLDGSQRLSTSLVTHFAVGTAWGALYSTVPSQDASVHPAVKGAGYGVAVWAVSYLGLVPAAGILTPATRHPVRRNLLMLGAHVVWGATMGALASALADHHENHGG